MGNINDFIVLVVIRQRVQERALFLCENLNNIYGEFPTSVDMKEPFVIKDFTQRPEILLLKRVNDIKYVLFQKPFVFNSNVGSAGSEELWSYMG